MRRVLAVLLALCMVFAFAGCGKNAKKEEWLLSKVTTIEEDGKKTNYVSEEYTYDDDGNKIKYVTYSAEDVVKEKTEYEYDSNGYLIEETRTDASGELVYKCSYKNDKNGNVTEEIVYADDGRTISTRETFTYDSKNRETGSKRYDNDGEKTNWSTTTYSSDGRHSTKKEYIDFQFSVCEIVTETDYDDEGKTLCFTVETVDEKSGNRSDKSTVTYTYNGRGDMTKQEDDDMCYEHRYEYDENDNITKDEFKGYYIIGDKKKEFSSVTLREYVRA